MWGDPRLSNQLFRYMPTNLSNQLFRTHPCLVLTLSTNWRENKVTGTVLIAATTRRVDRLSSRFLAGEPGFFFTAAHTQHEKTQRHSTTVSGKLRVRVLFNVPIRLRLTTHGRRATHHRRRKRDEEEPRATPNRPVVRTSTKSLPHLTRSILPPLVARIQFVSATGACS